MIAAPHTQQSQESADDPSIRQSPTLHQEDSNNDNDDNDFDNTARNDNEQVEQDDNLPSGEEDDDDIASVISEDEAAHQLDEDLKRHASVIQQDQEDTIFQQPEPTYPQQQQEIANLREIFGQSPTTKEFNLTNILFEKYHPSATC